MFSDSEESWVVLIDEGCKYYEKLKELDGVSYCEVDYSLFSDSEWKELGDILGSW